MKTAVAFLLPLSVVSRCDALDKASTSEIPTCDENRENPTRVHGIHSENDGYSCLDCSNEMILLENDTAQLLISKLAIISSSPSLQHMPPLTSKGDAYSPSL